MGLERPVRFQLQVREVARSLLLSTEPRSEGARESVVLFVAVRQRDEELVDERGELGAGVQEEGGGPRGSRGAKYDALAGLAVVGVCTAVVGHGISGRGNRVVPVFAIVEPKDESVDDVLWLVGLDGSSTTGSENTEDGVECGGGGM